MNKNLISKILEYIEDIKDEKSRLKYPVTSSEFHFRKYRKKYPQKLLVNERSQNDNGMLDIHNFDKLLDKELLSEIKLLFQCNIILKLINLKSKKWNQGTMFNAYYNNEIKSTRGFHVDAFYSVLKGLIYLSDVNDIYDGPYCYVKRSHQNMSFHDLNKMISNKYAGIETETPIINYDDITPVTGKAGTLIFSDQSGYHRGLPQKAGRYRTALVVKYVDI